MAGASDPAPRILACLVGQRVDREWELENIVVAEEFRSRGVGTRLISDFVDHVRTAAGDAIFLEVRESNRSARALYAKAGFAETGRRKGYYASPVEDAILFRLDFIRRIS